MTDPDSHFLRARRDFVLGYTDIAVSEDYLIVAQRMTRRAADSESLARLTEQVEQRCGTMHDRVSADAGLYQTEQIQQLARKHIEVYVPDSSLAAEAERWASGRRHRWLYPRPWAAERSDARQAAFACQTCYLPEAKSLG